MEPSRRFARASETLWELPDVLRGRSTKLWELPAVSLGFHKLVGASRHFARVFHKVVGASRSPKGMNFFEKQGKNSRV